MMHIPVEINKDSNLNGDYFQRTRSFLFSALGTIVASSVRAKGVRFFENGVVSLNLPVVGETVGARASRTTHPIALHLFSELYHKILNKPFIVDNPYIHFTKTQVLQEIAKYGHERLIGYTCSCAHQGYGQTRLSLHGGTCSQCIDRRFAILAAGLQAHDLERDYRTDVFRGAREEGREQNMAINYVRHANALNQMTKDQIGAAFNMELVRAVRYVTRRKAAEAEKLIDMHKNHALSVCRVLAEQISSEADNYVNGSLPAKSLLRLVANGEHQRPSWTLFGERIAVVLILRLQADCARRTRHDVLDGDLATEAPDAEEALGTPLVDGVARIRTVERLHQLAVLFHGRLSFQYITTRIGSISLPFQIWNQPFSPSISTNRNSRRSWPASSLTSRQ
jgi:hypothetical protein